MQRVDHEWLGCKSKKNYQTRQQAIRGATSRKEHKARHLNVYKCLFCSGFHLTSKPLWTKNKNPGMKPG